MSPLSTAFRQFQQDAISWSDFFAIARSHVERILTKKFHFAPDTRLEVIADFYPKFTRMCRDYTECGASFEAYLYTSLCFFCKSWYRRRSDRFPVRGTARAVEDLLGRCRAAGTPDQSDRSLRCHRYHQRRDREVEIPNETGASPRRSHPRCPAFSCCSRRRECTPFRSSLEL